MAKVNINIKFVDIDHTKIDKYIVNDEITFAPVIHAEWFKSDYDDYICTNCFIYSKNYHNYCPNCGAKMDQR